MRKGVKGKTRDRILANEKTAAEREENLITGIARGETHDGGPLHVERDTEGEGRETAKSS